ncbi:MAG: hypothetical protein H6767_04295 [Candidatus Peribacteria bacterium]|nr:MAG: hypothetical protein H6767_04295 [Candidatus Peribacteria bacterium]
MQGKPSFPIDNVIGSNIANILLIGGISGVFAREMLVKKELIHIDLPFFFLSTSLFIYFIYDGVFTWKEGLASIMILIIFILYTIADRPRKKEDREKVPMNYRYLVYIIGGIVGIYF